MPDSGARLTAGEIRGYAAAAGFKGKDLDTAVAIALAESGGNPRAHNSKPPDNSYGLWQINMLGGLGPARRKKFGLSSNDELYNPAVNAKIAHALYSARGGKFGDWSTYNSGSYKKFMSISSQSPAVPPKGGTTPPTNPLTGGGTVQTDGGILGIPAQIRQFTETVRQISILWLVIVIAIVLLILGFIILNREKVGKVAKVAATVAAPEVSAVASVAGKVVKGAAKK